MTGVDETPDERVLDLVDELVEAAASEVSACTLRMTGCVVLAQLDNAVSFLVAKEVDRDSFAPRQSTVSQTNEIERSWLRFKGLVNLRGKFSGGHLLLHIFLSSNARWTETTKQL